MSNLYEFDVEELIKDGRTTRQEIDEIKKWLTTTKFGSLPEDLIVLFLISCENQIDLAKNTLNVYFSSKKNCPEIFDDRDIERDDLRKALRTWHMASMPRRTKDNDVVHFFKLADTSYSNFETVPYMKLTYMLLDISQKTNPPNGLITVCDLRGFGLMHLTRLKLGIFKKYLHFLHEGFPIKLKAMYFINCMYMDKLLGLIKMFMKSELIDLIKIHYPEDNYKTLHQELSPECLPEDYGGECPPIEQLNEKTIQHFRELKSFYEAEERLRKTFQHL